jgi:hypothetical protein
MRPATCSEPSLEKDARHHAPSETGARVIMLTGNIPDKFIKREGNEFVTFEPPLATKAEERVWVRLDALYVMQPKLVQQREYEELEQVKSVRFCRWRKAFQESGGAFDPNFISGDPDRVMLQIPSVVFDPAKPSIELRVKGIQGVNNATGTGPQTEDTGSLTFSGEGGAQSKPVIFVADAQDDKTFNGGADENGVIANDDGPGDQTRLAGFGATIAIKFTPKGMTSPIELDVATMMQPLKRVKVALNIVTRNGSAASGLEKQTVQKHFDQAKLIYRQLGYDLVQQGRVADHALAPDFRALIDNAGGFLDGRILREYDFENTTKIGRVMDYLRDKSSKSGAYQLYWFDVTNFISHEKDNLNGAPAAGQATDFGGKAALIRFGHRNGGVVCAHELGHCMSLYQSTAFIPKLLMYSADNKETHEDEWRNDYLDRKRFHHTDEENLSPKH